ncbi:MAG TPA: GNAT family N-acetyltransferase [Nitriliruptorales bacterium]|nr:GNAT family N-acetyltransferase [Nitriliruptorales bacterium]
MFESAHLDEADDVMALRDSIAQWLIERGVDQWLRGDFPRHRLRAWIEQVQLHVHRRGGEIVATVAVLGDDPAFWSDRRGDAGYIHLLMVDRAHAASGLGDAAVTYAEQGIRDHGGRLARLDVVASNATLQCWYEQRGYRPVGTLNGGLSNRCHAISDP